MWLAKSKMGHFAHVGRADMLPLRAAAFCDMIDKRCLLQFFPCALPLATFSLSHAGVDMPGKVSQKTKPHLGGPHNTVTFAVVPSVFDRLQEV